MLLKLPLDTVRLVIHYLDGKSRAALAGTNTDMADLLLCTIPWPSYEWIADPSHRRINQHATVALGWSGQPHALQRRAVFEWTVRDLRHRLRRRTSPTFNVDGFAFCLHVYPQGVLGTEERGVAVYIECSDAEDVSCTLALSAVHRHGGQDAVWQTDRAVHPHHQGTPCLVRASELGQYVSRAQAMVVRATIHIVTLRVQVVQPTLTGPGLWGAIDDDPIVFSMPWTTTVRELREDLGVLTVRPLTQPRPDLYLAPRQVSDSTLLRCYTNGLGLVRVFTFSKAIPGPIILFVKQLCPVTRTLTTLAPVWVGQTMTPRRLLLDVFQDDTLEALIEPISSVSPPTMLTDTHDLAKLDGQCLILYPQGMADTARMILAGWHETSRSAVASLAARRYVSFHRIVPALERLGFNGERIAGAYMRLGFPSARHLLDYLSPGRHLDYCCDGCGAEDFVGIRYTCVVCHDYDLCSTCRIHPPTHGCRYEYCTLSPERRWTRIAGSIHTPDHDMVPHEAPTWI